MTTIALITGANKGIGYETARLLGELGMTVLVGARDDTRGKEAEAALRAGGAEARHLRLDVLDERSVEDAATTIEREYGRLDVLVNNAGIGEGWEPPSRTSLDTVRRVYETNVIGPIRVTNTMLPLLRRAPAARIVNVSSEVGSIASMSDPQSPLRQMTPVAYPSSKTALNMVTAQYAKELQDTPIKVNAANPGYCATDLNDHSGVRTATQGAEVLVRLATLDENGPSGVLWGPLGLDVDAENGVLPW